MEDVEAATRDEVEAFFRRYYVPANASLCLAGDIDEDDAFALADRYFGAIPGGVRSINPHAPDVTLSADVNLTMHDRVELERLYLSWPTVKLFHDDDAPLTLLADVLTRGRSSRLYRSLVMKDEVAQDISAYQSGRELAGSFGVSVTMRPGHDVAEARERIDAEIAAIAVDGPDESELTRVKNGRLAGFFHALESAGGFGGVADRLNAYNIYLNDPGRVTSDFVRYQEVDAGSVRQAARRYLDGRPRVSLAVHGKAAARKVAPLDRSVVPTSAAASAFRAPKPEIVTLRCGVPLWVLPERELPVVAATLVLAGGAGVQGPGEAGLAQLTAMMIDEGTTSRDSHEIAEIAESLGASLSASSGWDGSYLNLQSLTPHLPTVLELAADVLRNPTFPETEWRRIHGQTLAGLRAERDSAESRATRRMLQAIYPEGHPYRIPTDGDEATVGPFTRDDLVRFHATYHGPAGAAWVVAGDVDADEVAKRLDGLLGGWAGRPASSRPIVRPALPERPRILLIDRPGSVQAAVRVGHAGIDRLDPDYTDAVVFNQILGGQFTSRLNTKLREEKGFTYGVRSHFDVRRGPGPFYISAAIQMEAVAEALEDIRHEVFALLNDRPPTLAELDDARRSLIEGQARHFENPSALVSRYAGLFVHGLPSDHHAHFAERLAAVTPETLLAVAHRQVRPESLVAVVVADAKSVGNTLDRLTWAEWSLAEG